MWSPLSAGCRALLAASLPNRCLLCHQQIPSASQGLCACCLAATCYRQPICLGCGRELTVIARFCGSCMKHSPIPVVAPASYHSALGPLVGRVKYQQDFAPLPALVKALSCRVKALTAAGLICWPQALVPVPLHPARLQQRGFNQAWVIASMLSQELGLPLEDSLLLRIADTAPQAGLSGKARRRNLAKAFAVSGAPKWQRLVLVDDVVTTGTTIREAAKALAPWSPDVQVWCLARAEAPGLNLSS
ncbi:ComF family protein [Shewanella algae]|nr:ComF family protein [Shewanella algae]